ISARSFSRLLAKRHVEHFAQEKGRPKRFARVQQSEQESQRRGDAPIYHLRWDERSKRRNQTRRRSAGRRRWPAERNRLHWNIDSLEHRALAGFRGPAGRNYLGNRGYRPW